MIILGLNAYHGDSAAALVKDGKLVAAVEEERFRRLKHWAGFPSESIRYCLSEAGISLSEVDHIALNQNSKANLGRKLSYAISNRPNPAMLWQRLRNRSKRSGISQELAFAFPGSEFKGRVHAIEHHRAHLASAFLVSPFEEAATVSIDGFGDFSSTAWGVGKGADIEELGRVYFPHSMGVFYQALTQYLGFPHYGDEYKIMGLAPYGKPKYLDQLRQVVHSKTGGGFTLSLKYFRHHREQIAYDWDGGSPAFDELFSSELDGLLGPRRAKEDPLEQHHKDLAHSVQAIYEEVFFNLLNHLYEETGQKKLALAGGCAMNSVANGKVRRKTPFEQVYIQSAAGDAGGAIGAAFSVWQESGGKRDFVMDHAYWGPSATDEELALLVEESRNDLEAAGCTIQKIEDLESLCQLTAGEIADGSVVGWFQGRLEWGPRALGNRSILADPRRADIKDILNAKIKRRESFRPFAPSVLSDAVAEWFEEDDHVPFMMKVFQICEKKRPLIPAVTHVDGSGRLQTVSESTNPRYYKLISAFNKLTGVPMVLNTSFNENEPVVCRPQEALDCFLRTQMDVLVLGNWFVKRKIL